MTEPDETVDDRIDELYGRALEIVETIRTKEDQDASPLVALLDDLEDIVDEAEDILSTTDLTELAGAVDWEEVPEAFDLGDVLESIRNDDDTAVTLRKLITLVDLGEFWEAIDAREAWREKREFEDEMDDLTDDDGDRSSEGGSVAVRASDDAHAFDPESVENAVQSGMSDAVGEFRETLLDAHDRLETLRRKNAERFPDRHRTGSRNPTAVSTLPKAGASARGAALTSTVPEETKYSTAPNRQRIYGLRFDSARGEDRE